MGIIVSYDVSDKNPEMKAEMESKGYRDGWTQGPEGKKIRINLPDTTLWHSGKDKTVEQGLQDMKDATAKLRITLQRAVATPDEPTAQIVGDPHS